MSSRWPGESGEGPPITPSAYFINVGRGASVDEAALAKALRGGSIRGAALDVFRTDPLPADSPFWDAPNCIVSPHMSGDFFEYQTVIADQFMANWQLFSAGEPLNNLVDKSLGFAAAHS